MAMKYSINQAGVIVRDDGAIIPVDSQNTDYIEYLAWCASGNTAIPYAGPDEAWSQYQIDAKTSLDLSDVTIMRCIENNVTVPQEWKDYRKALRLIVSTVSGDASQAFPVRPEYPEGS
ncbi:hypothetical protein [Caballeronia sp. AZ1_KS37]|uniref:hypothetical protein n=1 Tax=Caballeronia sp. AZ1_KS37 TaxID=2921756 RepID=UPI00202804C0|nr:hypothetical protein [Caballeronia sp. AZ1_KS37]